MKRIERKNNLMKQIELTYGEEIEEVLRILFVDQNKTQKEIATELHISYLTVIRWLRASGVRSRRLTLGD